LLRRLRLRFGEALDQYPLPNRHAFLEDREVTGALRDAAPMPCDPLIHFPPGGSAVLEIAADQ
jgi:hypothetical protein